MATAQSSVFVRIGAAIDGAFNTAFSTADKRVQGLGASIRDLKSKASNLQAFQDLQEKTRMAGYQWQAAKAKAQQLREEMAASGPPTKRQAAELRRADQAAERAALSFQKNREALAQMRSGLVQSGVDTRNLAQEQSRLGQEIQRNEARFQRLGQLAAQQRANMDARGNARSSMFDRAGSAIALGGLMRAPLSAFMELDAAMNNMTVAMTDASGKVPVLFGEIKKQTVELGNLLPGTTADFVNLASALKEQGMPIEAIAGGALKSAAHLSVVMKMVPEQAGEMVAKLREAFQLADGEFATMADYTQRARFGFGLKSEDLLLGAKYYGGKLNALGLTGAENVRKIYAIQGMAAQQGMDGSTFGTNFSMMLTRVGLMTEKLHKNSKEMRAVNAELNKAGVHMEFFDKAGRFAGVDNMVQQLDKLKKLSMEKRLQVLSRIFGEEGGRVADLISRNGVAGYEKALQSMDKEASLNQRIAIAVSSFKNQWEAFTGTVTNFLAAVGAPLAEMFTPILTTLNTIVGGPMQTFVEQNKTAIQVVGSIVAAGAGIMAVGAGLAFVRFMSTFAVGGLLSFKSAVMVAGEVMQFLGVAIGRVGMAMVASPIGLWITGIALAAVLIYKFWEPLKAFFSEFFSALSEGLAPIGQAISDAFGPIWSVVGPVVMPILSTIGKWFGKLLEPIDKASETTAKFGEVGRLVGTMVASAFELMLKPITLVLDSIKWLNENIGGVLDRASNFLGIGGGTLRLQPAGGMPSPVAAGPATSGSGGTYAPQYNVTVQGGGTATENAEAVRRFMQQKEAEDRAKARGRLYDTGGGF